MKKVSIRSKLLILAIVAQYALATRRCTAYSIARALGYSHVTARKRLKMLEEQAVLTATTVTTLQGYGRVEYKLTDKGKFILQENAHHYVAILFDSFPL